MCWCKINDKYEVCWRPFGPAFRPLGLTDFVLCTLRAFRQCAPRPGSNKSVEQLKASKKKEEEKKQKVKGRESSLATIFQVQKMDSKCEPWPPPSPCSTPMLENFISSLLPLPGSGEKAEVPASPSRLWMARWVLCWNFNLGPLQPLALELQRHSTKQLDVLTSSLANNAVVVIVVLDARNEMPQDGKPGKGDGRKPSHLLQSLYNHHLLLRRVLHHLLLQLGDWSPLSRIGQADPASASWMGRQVRSRRLPPLHHHHLLLQYSRWNDPGIAWNDPCPWRAAPATTPGSPSSPTRRFVEVTRCSVTRWSLSPT